MGSAERRSALSQKPRKIVKSSRPVLTKIVSKATFLSTDVGDRLIKTLYRTKNTRQQLVLYKNRLIDFKPNQYLAEPERLWQIESIVGSKALNNSLFVSKKINDRFIEALFENVPFSFYLDADETYLLGYNDELTQADFGPLSKISALAALRRYGVAALEQAKEKTAARL